MAFPWIRRRTHDAIVRVLTEKHRGELAGQRQRLERAHTDAIDRIRGRLSPRVRDAVDRLLDNARYSVQEPR